MSRPFVGLGRVWRPSGEFRELKLSREHHGFRGLQTR